MKQLVEVIAKALVDNRAPIAQAIANLNCFCKKYYFAFSYIYWMCFIRIYWCLSKTWIQIKKKPKKLKICKVFAYSREEI